MVSLGTIVSAFFILTANAWMQHPVGYRIVGGKAELTDFWAVLRNDTLWAGTVDGITQVQNAEAARYGPSGYVPVLWVTYWSFRLMVGSGFLMLAVPAWALWRSRRGRRKAFELGRWTLWFLAACIVTPFLASTFGWLFTEMGRQPWIVYGLMKTGAGISPGVSTADVAVTLGGLVLLYTVLGVIDVVLMFRAARGGLGDAGEPRPPGQPGEPTATELVY